MTQPRRVGAATQAAGAADDPDLALSWADPRQAGLDAVLGAVVAEVRVLEHEFRLDRVDGASIRVWALAGLELTFDDGRGLQLYNVLSDLTIATQQTDSGTWRRRVVSV